MKFAVQLIGSKLTWPNVASCFQGDFATIRMIGDDWFLESSAFNACTDPGEVFPIADKVLRLMYRVTGVYGGLFSFCETGYVQAFNDAGEPTMRGMRRSIKVRVYSVKGLQELQKLHGEQPWGSSLVALAMTDERLREALALVEEDLQWPHLYNILEFLGGVETVVKKTWMGRMEAVNFRQTANHYRHLGSPKKYPLPARPPSLPEATSLMLDLLSKWVSDKFGTPLRAHGSPLDGHTLDTRK